MLSGISKPCSGLAPKTAVGVVSKDIERLLISSILFSMESELIKLIFLAKLEAALVFAALIFHQLPKNRPVCSSMTPDYKFCEIRWFEFISEKQKWNTTCGTNASNISTCCIAEKDYLLQRFKRYSHLCPLEGKAVFFSPYS